MSRSYDAALRPSLLAVPGANYHLGYSYRDGSRLDTVSAVIAGVSQG